MAIDDISYKLLVIGGSAGSLEVLLPLIESLKGSFCTPIIVVLHRKTDSENLLSDLIMRRSRMRTKEAEDKEPIEENTIYVAPADYHLLVEKDFSLSLDHSEKINYSRPSIDVTFETAAEACGKRVIGILLSGANEDGAEGIQEIRRRGGVTVVQDPSTAVVPFMPEKAITTGHVDYILSIEEMADLLNKVC